MRNSIDINKEDAYWNTVIKNVSKNSAKQKPPPQKKGRYRSVIAEGIDFFDRRRELNDTLMQNEAETSSFRGFFDNVNQSSVEEPTKDKSTMTTFEPSFLTVVHQKRSFVQGEQLYNPFPIDEPEEPFFHGPIEQVDDRNPMHPPPPKEHLKTQSRRPSKRPAPKVQPSTFDDGWKCPIVNEIIDKSAPTKARPYVKSLIGSESTKYFDLMKKYLNNGDSERNLNNDINLIASQSRPDMATDVSHDGLYKRVDSLIEVVKTKRKLSKPIICGVNPSEHPEPFVGFESQNNHEERSFFDD